MIMKMLDEDRSDFEATKIANFNITNRNSQGSF